MVNRQFWLSQLEKAFARHSVVWLSGVRRSGKTFLCQSLPKAEYLDCELPSTRRMLEDPESFLSEQSGKTLILDEIHRLGNPSELLKIASDHFKKVRIIATGSSTLGASKKFRDTLTGRKADVWLTPIIAQDLKDFGQPSLEHRLLRGGLPPFFMAKQHNEKAFTEWMDGFWSKDIQELFHLEKRYSFQKFVELLHIQSGGIFEATSFAKPCEASRATINNYLGILEATFLVHILRPFHTSRANEIISAPKVYAFDTGFVCHYRGWNDLRPEDKGILWEHFVLNELQARLQIRTFNYWRDKQKHEIDIIIPRPQKPPIAIECKWRAGSFNDSSIVPFLRAYPQATVFIVTTDTPHPYTKRIAGTTIHFTGLESCLGQLIKENNLILE
jgi:predicted AAA+ superfamily ATPase